MPDAGRHFFPRIAAAAAALAAAGCALSPEVSAVSARQQAVTAEGSEVRILVELENPNAAPVELTRWEYSVVVGDRTAYSGEWIASLTIPPKEHMRAELPAFVPASLGDLSGASWRVGGTLGYRATGKLDKLLYQLGVNRLNALFGCGGTGVAPAAPALPAPATAPAAPTPTAPAPAAPPPGPAAQAPAI